MSEKKCPFCAESINAEAIKCKHCGSDLSPGAKKPVAMISCNRCDVAMVATQVRKFVSLGGVVGTLLLLFGVVLLVANALVIGFVFMVVGILVGTMGGKKTVMICPSCGTRGRTLAS